MGVVTTQGKIAVKQDILSDLVTGSRTSSLWKHKPCPFVYLYDKIANIDLCIDSRYVIMVVCDNGGV